MTWDAIGALGEIAGSVAVILTLLVLIRQIREATNATRAATMESIGDRIQERLLLQVADADLAALLVRATQAASLSEFNEVDAHRLKFWWFSMFNHQQLGFNQAALSAASTSDLDFRRSFLIQRLRDPIVRECWNIAKSGQFTLRDEFVAFVEEAIE